jgi:hypothetical protein
MDWACSAHGCDDKYLRNFGSKALRERGHLGDIGAVDGRIILKLVLGKMDSWVYIGVT